MPEIRSCHQEILIRLLSWQYQILSIKTPHQFARWSASLEAAEKREREEEEGECALLTSKTLIRHRVLLDNVVHCCYTLIFSFFAATNLKPRQRFIYKTFFRLHKRYINAHSFARFFPSDFIITCPCGELIDKRAFFCQRLTAKPKIGDKY